MDAEPLPPQQPLSTAEFAAVERLVQRAIRDPEKNIEEFALHLDPLLAGRLCATVRQLQGKAKRAPKAKRREGEPCAECNETRGAPVHAQMGRVDYHQFKRPQESE